MTGPSKSLQLPDAKKKRRPSASRKVQPDDDWRPWGLPELKGVTLHGLRCTAVIRLRQEGLSTGQIGDIVGMSLSTIARYCRYADRKSGGKAALIKMADHRTAKERKL